jgi:hypothetical protein
MQIHEITTAKQLDEGLMDTIKSAAGAVGRGVSAVGRAGSAIAKPFQAVGAAYKAGTGTDNINLLANRSAKIWNQYAENLKATTPDPARYATLYRQALMAFVQKNFLGGQSLATAINKQELTQIIDKISAVADNPQQVAQLFPALVQTSVASAQDVGANSLIKVVSTNPPVIQYRTNTYVIGDQGEWTDQRTKKRAEQSFQFFLDTEARKAGISV